ncbi:MAG: glycoside hydrolase family 5 protein [Patescibacteria group bacterium]
MTINPLIDAKHGDSNSNYTVNNNTIYENGNKIILKGISWFGAEENPDLIPHGLWKRGYKSMISQIKEYGFNAIRIPFCSRTLKNNPINYIDPKLNPELAGKNSLHALDVILEEINNQGLYILLDYHKIDCIKIQDLWYTPWYSETSVSTDLVNLSRRYRHLNKLVGIEIKNEPYGRSTWSNSRPSTDFNKFAERVGKSILRNNPDILIFVSGVHENPECNAPLGKWWGGNLSPIRCFPIDHKSIPEEKLILSPHVYGPDVYYHPYFRAGLSKEILEPIWESHFGFTTSQYTLAITEFGGKYTNDSEHNKWQELVMNYFAEKQICNTFYWSWNPNSGDTGGVLHTDWLTPNQEKLDLLNRYWSKC